METFVEIDVFSAFFYFMMSFVVILMQKWSSSHNSHHHRHHCYQYLEDGRPSVSYFLEAHWAEASKWESARRRISSRE
jgi:hypothetical protein